MLLRGNETALSMPISELTEGSQPLPRQDGYWRKLRSEHATEATHRWSCPVWRSEPGQGSLFATAATEASHRHRPLSSRLVIALASWTGPLTGNEARPQLRKASRRGHRHQNQRFGHESHRVRLEYPQAAFNRTIQLSPQAMIGDFI